MQSPSHESQAVTRTALYLALASLTIAACFVLRYPSLFEPRWYGDEGIFSAIAQNIRHGRTLYSGAWDNKPPLIFFTYAAVQSLFGTGTLALHLVATIVVLATQVVVMVIALRLYGRRRALVAGVVFAFGMGTPLLEADLAMTETFMILPTSLAVLAFVLAQQRPESRRTVPYAVAGLLLGVAAGYKQVAVFDGAAIGMMIWLTHEHRMRALAPIAIGFAVPQIAFALLFAAMGAFTAYWYAIVGSLGVYSSLSDDNPFVKFVGFLPALLAVAWLVRRKRLGGAITMQFFPVLWLAFAVAGATSSTFAFPHYLQQAVPALALVIAANPLSLETEDTGKIALAIGGILVAAVVFGQFGPAFRERKQLHPIEYYRTFASHQYGTMSDLDYDYYFDGKTIAVRDIVRYIDADDAGSTAYAWSELPWLYAAGGLTNPTRYYTSFLGEVIPGAKTEILRDLDAHPPVYVVVSEDTYAPFDGLERFLDGRYALLHQQNDWRIYRLTSASGRLPLETSLARTPAR